MRIRNDMACFSWRIITFLTVIRQIHMQINFINQMKSLNIILASIFSILFLYIIVGTLLSLSRGTTSDCQYNIGCYTVHHSINKTEQVLAHIATIQHLENMSKIAVELQPLPLVDPAAFQNNSVQLALSFEKFIKKLTQQHDYNMENVQIFREVAKAEKEYLACKATIDTSYSEADCSANWAEYTNCSTRMDKMRFKLEMLTKEEGLIRDQISEVIKMPNGTISALDLAKRNFNDSMKTNQRLRADLSAKLQPLERNLWQKNYDRDEALQKYLLTSNNLRQCQENKKKHDACEQISKEVRNINTENIAYLKVMMESKEQLLRNLQRILDSQKNSKEIEELNDKYLKHKEEYINMLKEFISLTRQNEKACGCTTELEADLKRELQALRQRAQFLATDIQGLNYRISQYNQDLKHLEEEREDIVRKYKEMLEQNERVPLSPETELSRLNRHIKAKHNQILELKGIYRGIGGECEDLKRRLNQRARDINGISDCVSKKNYFLQLKKQTAQYVHSDNDEQARMLESKRELAYYLNSIGPQ